MSLFCPIVRILHHSLKCDGRSLASARLSHHSLINSVRSSGLFIRDHSHVAGAEEDIETAVREALANAILHGNLENPRKRVYLTCSCTLDGDISITVRDEGQGFDPYYTGPGFLVQRGVMFGALAQMTELKPTFLNG